MKRIITLLALSLCTLVQAATLTPAEVHAKAAAVAPISGVSLGSLTDKTTWRVQYQDSATDTQKAAAQSVIDAIDLSKTSIALVHKSIATAIFYSRLTTAERSALKASTDATVAAWVDKMPYCSVIDIDTEESEAMQAYLVALGILTETRKNEIFK